jgi:hypothetical protein
MDWPTTIGLILGGLSVLDLAYKYGSAIFKKIYLRARVRKFDTPFKIMPDLISFSRHHYVPQQFLLKKI